MVKQTAARHGLLATFMGKLRDDDEGSGMHVHVSLHATTARTRSTTRRAGTGSATSPASSAPASWRTRPR